MNGDRVFCGLEKMGFHQKLTNLGMEERAWLGNTELWLKIPFSFQRSSCVFFFSLHRHWNSAEQDLKDGVPVYDHGLREHIDKNEAVEEQRPMAKRAIADASVTDRLPYAIKQPAQEQQQPDNAHIQ